MTHTVGVSLGTPGWACKQGEWVLFLHLTMKEHPGHIYSNSTPEANTLTNNNVQRSHIEVKSDVTQHSEWHDVIMSMMSP